jgi:asparagine N-glycosylation enzyme membrane subunit Stt3
MIAEWRKSYYEFLASKWIPPIKNFLVKYWYVFVLIGIFLIAFQIRAMSNVPNQLLDFDPIFQYRYTWYLVNWGHLPVWDELSYYPGRIVNIDVNPPLIYYLTALGYYIQQFLGRGWSLMTTASFMSAIYGALIVIPAFLLGRELSNKYGGLIAAILIGTAPQILDRTFGSSFDTDQLVIFSIVFSLWAGYYMYKKKSIPSVCLFTLALLIFILSNTAWAYALAIVFGSLILYFVMNFIFRRAGKIKEGSLFGELKDAIKLTVLLVIILSIAGYITTGKIIIAEGINDLLIFTFAPQTMIVNISIAELQSFNLGLDNLIQVVGGFTTGMAYLDDLLLTAFITLIAIGFIMSYKKRNLMGLSFLLTLLVVGIFTAEGGYRFIEFSVSIFSVLIAVGFGYLIENVKLVPAKVLLLTFVVLLFIFVIHTGFAIGQQLGPGTDPNWENAWTFLRTRTPADSLVGTWWDPGHMIAGKADRRNIADGAHCPDDPNWCLWGINMRIEDLGKIMATTDENESISLIKKYQADSSKVYWIASVDLIGKYRWLQYFGTGCDGTTDKSCPLYTEIPATGNLYNQYGQTAMIQYQNVNLYVGGNLPIPMYQNGINIALFKAVLYNVNGTVQGLNIDAQKDQIISSLKPLETNLNGRFVNQTIDLTAWIAPDYSYMVLIPDNLLNTVLTKMYLLNGQGLTHFKQVYANSELKIYEVED